MEDLIKRNDAIEAINKAFDRETLLYGLVRKIAVDAVKSTPSADRLQGEWITDEYQNILMKNLIDKGEKWRVCSICGAGHKLGYMSEKGKYYSNYSRFCPCCGAEMKGADDD